MRLRLLIPIIALFALAPGNAEAALVINEISWMGTDEGGANCEWIELYNSSDDIVALAGYTLAITNAGATSPSKVLALDDANAVYSGIAAHGYYLIARNSGACGTLSPGTSADWLGSFGSGISNSGALLELFNGSELEDSVDASSGWKDSGVGGVNDSGKPKQTPQRVGLGQTWLTGTPTPRGPNQAPEEPEIDEPPVGDTATGTPVVTVGGSVPLVPVLRPVPDVYVQAGGSRIVTVGAETPYVAIAYDSTGEIKRNADISWNFGDGGYAHGRSVRYAYEAPGTYEVVVRATTRDNTGITHFTVVANASSVVIDTLTPDGIVLRNAGGRMEDLSLWELRTLGTTFVLPPDTVLPPGRSVLFLSAKTGIPASSTPALYYPKGERVAALAPSAYARAPIEASSARLLTSAPVRPLAYAPRQLATPAPYAPFLAPDLGSFRAFGVPLGQ